MLFQCLVFFFLTVKHQRNEVLPGFGIGVSSAKLTRWEISVFSCWQSIYLPSNVEYVCGMNTERHEKMEEEKEVDVAVCVRSFSRWEMFLSGELHNSPWIITPPWIIQSHMSLEPISIDTPVNVKTSTKEWHDFFHFHTPAVVHYLFFTLSRQARCEPLWRGVSLCVFVDAFWTWQTFLNLSLEKLSKPWKRGKNTHT